MPRTERQRSWLRQALFEAEPRDAAWAVFFLRGQRLKRVVKTHDLREWSANPGIPAMDGPKSVMAMLRLS